MERRGVQAQPNSYQSGFDSSFEFLLSTTHQVYSTTGFIAQVQRTCPNGKHFLLREFLFLSKLKETPV